MIVLVYFMDDYYTQQNMKQNYIQISHFLINCAQEYLYYSPIVYVCNNYIVNVITLTF